MEVVVQPVVPPTMQVGPVKPLIHIHEQPPPESIDEPPFLHSVSAFDWHCCSWAAAVDWAGFFLWITRSSMGTTTAAAMTIRIIRSMIRKPQAGRPQHLRRGLSDFSSRSGEVSSNGAGHDAPL